MKQIVRVFLFVPVLLMLVVAVFAQGSVITLKQEHVAFVPKTYYISDVTDSIPDSVGIGTIYDGTKKQPVTIEGGVAAAFKKFIDHNITQDKGTQAVVLNVSKMDIDIKKKGASWAVSASMSITFYAGGIKLVQYSGKGSAELDSDPREYAEQFVRQTIEKDMSKFDGYWAEHKNSVAVSEEVKVNVIVAKTINKPNCIVYNTKRQLLISDFTGPIQDDVSELAATYSGIAFSTTGATEKGQLVINVTLTPYFDKTKSWFKEAGKNPVLLAHEQAHFDITAIKACELAEALRKAAFTKDNYLALFDQLQQQYVGQSNEEQNTYDNETNHGTIPDAQQAWQKRISLKVKALDCY